MRIKETLKFWKEQRVKQRKAQQLLKEAEDEDLAAAEALWRLNRYARANWGAKALIYAVKRGVIRELCNRHPYQARLERQKMTCFRCGGSGNNPFDELLKCERCFGTGVYREHLLVAFDFNINGRRYNWHQPKVQVDWPVTLSVWGEQDFGWPDYVEQGARETDWRGELEKDEAELLCWLCSAWLKKAGGEIPYRLEEIALWQLVKKELTWEMQSIRQQVRLKMRQFRNKRAGTTGAATQREADPPF